MTISSFMFNAEISRLKQTKTNRVYRCSRRLAPAGTVGTAATATATTTTAIATGSWGRCRSRSRSRLCLLDYLCQQRRKLQCDEAAETSFNCISNSYLQPVTHTHTHTEAQAQRVGVHMPPTLACRSHSHSHSVRSQSQL